MSNTKRVTDLITISDLESWTPKRLVIISAGTGAGKSYFVKNHLYEYAKSEDKKILFLIHRTNCIHQFQYELERDEKTDVIDLMTYQKIEYDILNYNKHINFSKYKYIVCDEFHYFISDASFNKTTDISFTEILKQKQCIKIFMSATGEAVEHYLSQKNRQNIYKYVLPPNYSHVEELTFFSREEDINYIADLCIKQEKKAIFFLQSATKAYELFKRYSKCSIFNCGKSDKHFKYVNEEEIAAMLKNECFEKQFLITTSCFDAGANIIDKNVKVIVADIKDFSSLIQCLGRKRILDAEDRVSFFIKTIDNQQLSGLQRSTSRQIEMADYLEKHSTQELILKYPRQVDRNVIIYDNVKVNKQKNMATKKINWLMYQKKKSDIEFYKHLMEEEYGYCKYLARYLGFYDETKKWYHYKALSTDPSLDTYLKSIVNLVMLERKDRNPLIEKLNVRSNGRQLKRKDSLNKAMLEMGLPYKIKEFATTRRINGAKKKYKHAWKVIQISPPQKS